MTVSKYAAILLLCTLGSSIAQAEEASLVDKTGRAINKGAKATADGAEYVAKKVVNGLETGAKATERGFNSAAAAVGLHEQKGSGAKSAENSAPANTSSSEKK